MNGISENKGLLDRCSRIHLTGIGGIGMSGIAEYLHNMGYKITGSDSAPTNITSRLQNLGIKVFTGHSENNISDNTELLIYTPAIEPDNPEIVKAKRNKIHIIKRAQILGEIVNSLYLISVSGSHGKTTTTALIGKILIDAGLDPVIFAGGTLNYLNGSSSRIGNNNIAVVEADEYDRSFYFLKSDIIVVTNIEMDHSDIYRDINDVCKSFLQFCLKSREKAVLIGCSESENVMNVFENIKDRKKIFYGFGKQNDYCAGNPVLNEDNSEYVFFGEKIAVNLKGMHNILNSLAAIAVCKCLDIKNEIIFGTLKSFAGIDRRLQIKFTGDITIYDDYAHHPTEIRESFSAVNVKREGRIITVFQPHLYSRTKDFYREFAEALKNNDFLILADIYPAREEPIPGISSLLIEREFLKISENKVYYLKTFKEITDKLDKIIKSGDTIIFQGAGNITDLCNKYVEHHKSIFNNRK